MKERPILFSGPMVRAILDGRKTQTRRVVNVEKWKSGKWARDFVFCDDPNLYQAGDFNWVLGLSGLPKNDIIDKGQHLSIPYRHKDDPVIPWDECGQERIHCPHGDPGMMGEPADRLWVKETFALIDRGQGSETVYRADGGNMASWFADVQGWRPSIFMPRWASRITLEIVAVRVERLQDISEADAWAEGCKRGTPTDNGGWFPAEEPDPSGIGLRAWDDAREWYADLWESINGPGSWDANPWVWVIEFKRIKHE